MPLFWDWLESEAGLTHSDGCSGVTQFNIKCCWLHDCEGYHGADAPDAYRLYRQGIPDYWQHARRIEFDEWNRHLRKCHFSHTRLGWINPMTWWRWWAVERLGRGAWEKHRQRERDAA